MTARYSNAERTAAKRLGYSQAFLPEWIPGLAISVRDDKAEAAFHRREAKRWDRYAADAALIARAVAREQRRAAREAKP